MNNLKKEGFSKAKSYSIPKDPSLDHVFDIDIDAPILRCFVDASHASDLQKRRSITGVVFTFCWGAIVYKSKTQSITTGSSTEAEFIAAHTAGKLTRYLQSVLKELGFEQKQPTVIQEKDLICQHI